MRLTFALAPTLTFLSVIDRLVAAPPEQAGLYPWEGIQDNEGRRIQEETCADSCPESSVKFKGDTKDAIFNQISASEMASIVDYLKAEGVIDLNRVELASADDALNKNYIMHFTLGFPPKAEALAYLDHDGPIPDRYAIVTVNRGGHVPKDVMEYKVGPLVDGMMDLDKASYSEFAEPVDWAKRQLGPVDWAFLQDAVPYQAFLLKDLFKEASGGYCYGYNSTYGTEECGFDTFTFWDYTSLDSVVEGKRIHALHFWIAPSEEDWGYVTLHPFPLSFNYIEDPEKNPLDWEAYNFEYCYQGPYDTAEDLMDAFYAGELTMCPVYTEDFAWSNTNPVEPLREDSEILNPRICSVGGHRFAVESAGEYIPESEARRRAMEMGQDSLKQKIAKQNPFLVHGQNRGRSKASPRSHFLRETKTKQRNLEEEMSKGDGTGHMVSWLDWTFHVSVDGRHGMVVRDLKFKGERVAYELSIQEYFASYSSIGSTAQVFYYDSNYEIGTELSELAVGIDCPEGALYLPVLVEEFEGVGHTEPNHMCIFETPTGEAMWRHGYAGGGAKYPASETRGLPRTVLTVRTISTMGNYDYLASFMLMADGVVEAKLELGGYMLTSYAPPEEVMENMETPYFAQKVAYTTNGVLHDHIIGFKVDLDIGGVPENSFETLKIKYGTYEEVTGNPKPGWHSYNGVKYADRVLVDTEDTFYSKDYDYFIVSSPEMNEWGNYKGYALHFDHTVATEIFPPDHPITGPLGWAYSNVAVTAYKDEEKFCTYPSNFNVIGEPVPETDIYKFLDGESIVEEDLVLWIMVGKQHYPKAEDVPLVSNFGTGFTLKPRNFFDRAAFEDLADYPDAPKDEPMEKPTPSKGGGMMMSKGGGMMMKMMKMMGKGKGKGKGSYM